MMDERGTARPRPDDGAGASDGSPAAGAERRRFGAAGKGPAARRDSNSVRPATTVPKTARRRNSLVGSISRVVFLRRDSVPRRERVHLR